ncbi:MAG: amidohydrolase family protein [Eggerthellaceae bacterium]|jgi:predicted TIM-barrel fold metal-dependent hydrolase
MAVIDAHAHIYPDKLAQRASDAIGHFYLVTNFGNGSMQTLLESGKRAGITHYIVHSVATTAHAVESINNFIHEQCQIHPEFIGFAAMHQDYPDKEKEVERAIELGLHGFKLHPDTQQVDMDDPRLMEFYEMIAGRMPLVMHTGDYRYHYSHPSKLLKILKTFPDLVVDAAHFGGWSIFDRGYDFLHEEEFIRQERLFIDTSSSQFFLGNRHMEELIRLWGVDRVMFGSDYPMWSPETEHTEFMKMHFTDDEFDKLIWHNAENFAGVKVN